MTWLREQLDVAFGTPVERDHWEDDRAFRRRRVVVVATLVVGAALLGFSLSVAPGDPLFYATTLGLAVVWTVGAFLSGPLHAGWVRGNGSRLERPVLQPLVVGLLAVAVFAVGSLLVVRVPVLEQSVNDVLEHARQGSLALVAALTFVNGLAEELFFRGALYAAVGVRHAVAVTTVVYAATTVVTGNVMLVFAAAVLGVLVGLQRRVSGGVLAPMITHVTWSLGMLFLLPPLMTAFG